MRIESGLISGLTRHEPGALAASQSAPGAGGPEPSLSGSDDGQLREAFQAFVGQTFFGQLMASMRKTVGQTAYFHGGRAEEVFQKQMDQLLVERMSEATADNFSGPMYELFTLSRR